MRAAAPVSKRTTVAAAWEIAPVVALSLALRTLSLLSLPIFFDEAGYIRWAVDIWDQRTRMALFIPMTEDGKQPLFMWLAAVAVQLTPDPLLGGRIVSALAGVASTVGVYFAGYWLAGRGVGAVAALLYAAVPFNLFFDRMALVEALLNAGGVWSLGLGVFIAMRARRRREAVLAGIALGMALAVALWTKMTGAFVIPLPLLCGLLLARRRELATSLLGFIAASVVFGAVALLLSRMPGAEKLVDKAGSFAADPRALLAFPVEWWTRNLLEYGTWIQVYFVAPLWWLLLAAVAWAVLLRRKVALLLLACWAVATLPPTLMAVPKLYASRYIVHGVFPLYLLAADFAVWAWGLLRMQLAQRLSRAVAVRLTAAALLLAGVGPSLAFDYRLLEAPERAGLPPADQRLYVTGWTAGYGFVDAMRLVKQRAVELTRNGQPVIVLSDDMRGTPYAALKVYMKGMPDVHHYVDMHLSRDAEGFMAAWKWHRVPILIVGNQGYDDLEAFERGVPQAKRIGFFPKPEGKSSFRVYEVAKEDLEP